MPERILEWFEVTPPFQKFTLIGVMVGLIGVGFYFSVAEPKIRDIQALRGEMQQIDQHSEEQAQKVARLEELIVQAERLGPLLQSQERMLGLDVESSQLLQGVSETAQRLGITLTLWRPGEPLQDPTQLFLQVPITLHVKGGYHRIALFLEAIRHLPKVLSVTRLTMRASRGVQDPLEIQAAFELVGYERSGEVRAADRGSMNGSIGLVGTEREGVS